MGRRYLCGPFTRFGLTAAVAAAVIDQASKLYLLYVYDLATNGPIRLGPFFDFILTRNTGQLRIKTPFFIFLKACALIRLRVS